MTIAGLTYGPYLGAPKIGISWGNLVGLTQPTLLPDFFPSGAIRTVNAAVDRLRASGVIPPLGIGETPAPVQPAAPDWQNQEVCWVNTDSGDVACFPWGSIFQPGGVWEPAGTWTPETTPPPVDPEYLPTRRVNEPPISSEEPSVAIDWGAVFSGAIDLAQGQTIGGYTIPNITGTGNQFVGTPGQVPPAGANGAAMYSGSCPPRKTRTLTIDCATGAEVKRTRRRRRRLLTSSDLGDLAQLQALVGKGSNAMSVAVSKAIR